MFLNEKLFWSRKLFRHWKTMDSMVHKSLIKPVVSWEFWVCDSTEPESLIKPVVYEEFWTCKSKGPGLLIKPVVYEEFWARDCKSSGILIKPVVYEEFHAALKLEILSRVFELSRIRFRLNRKKIIWKTFRKNRIRI